MHQYITIIIFFVAIILYCIYTRDNLEHYNDGTGLLCKDCEGKPFNECIRCFNCVYCVDKWGNGQCIGGDSASGPYNKEKCNLLYSGDQYIRMKQNNAHYECEFGPPVYNNVIGVNPPGQLNAV